MEQQKKNKNVQIPLKLFLSLVRYFLLDDRSETCLKTILDGLEAKLDTMVKHELYTASKTAETEEEREEARKKYLDKIGMRDSFRW